METRIGISGWRYPQWRKSFYPEGLPQRFELQYASSKVNTIEINGSFYSLQMPSSYIKWSSETPEDFCFSLKGPRFITHMKHLKNVEAPLGNFFASGVLHLKQKLGPILWQLPPQFHYDEERLDQFFSILPRTVEQALNTARQADRVLPSFPEELDFSQPVRHALEVRSQTFENPDFIDLLKKHNVALVIADTAGLFPYMEDITSNFIYVRLHGEEKLYAGGYSEESLQWWSHRLRLWRQGESPKDALVMSDSNLLQGSKKSKHTKDLFVYFDNDINTRAPYDAMALHQLLQGPPTPSLF
jgi:uncharacterized protein YecE (DUF72 family)